MDVHPPENLKDKSNQELMRLAQQDIDGAYGIIYQRLYAKFVNIAYKILLNESDAKDATQQALITGYIKRNRFLFFANVETWLIRILINKAKDIIRKNGPKNPTNEEHDDEPEEMGKGEILDPDIGNKTAVDDPRADKKTRLTLMFLEECLKRLSEEEKTNLELRELYEMPYKEIVKIANEKFGHSSLGNIKNKTDSAKRKVKDCIEKRLLSHEIILKNKH